MKSICYIFVNCIISSSLAFGYLILSLVYLIIYPSTYFTDDGTSNSIASHFTHHAFTVNFGEVFFSFHFGPIFWK